MEGVSIVQRVLTGLPNSSFSQTFDLVGVKGQSENSRVYNLLNKRIICSRKLLKKEIDEKRSFNSQIALSCSTSAQRKFISLSKPVKSVQSSGSEDKNTRKFSCNSPSSYTVKKEQSSVKMDQQFKTTAKKPKNRLNLNTNADNFYFDCEASQDTSQKNQPFHTRQLFPMTEPEHFFNVFQGSRDIVKLEKLRKESGGSWSSLKSNSSSQSKPKKFNYYF